jgi:threonine/homoserine/homoserine lactone efflux protein
VNSELSESRVTTALALPAAIDLPVFSNPWMWALASFAFASSITPGPNNILLAASGARFGLRRTFTHASGIWAGMVSLLVMAALGFGALATSVPGLVKALQYAAAVALLWTAFGIWRARPIATDANSPSESPWSFWQGFGFQFLNPKALMMAVTAIALTPLATTPDVGFAVLVTTVFMTISVPCTWVWAMAGLSMRKALSSPRRQRAFNIVMALVLVATIPLSLMPTGTTS